MSVFDLNLTRVFVLLNETGSVTITADTSMRVGRGLPVTRVTQAALLEQLMQHGHVTPSSVARQ